MSEKEINASSPLVLEFPSLKFSAKLGVRKNCQDPDPVAIFEKNVEPQWGEKKQQVLTTWINKVLTPPIEVDDMDLNARRLVDPKEIIAAMKKVADGQGQPLTSVPSKEEASLQVYVSRRWMSKLRSQASNIYLTLEPLLSRIDEAVDSLKIAIRKDKCIYNDVGLQKFFLKSLLSVYPIWLRVGLETIYGMEIGQIKNNKDVYGLTCFIMERMFNDPDLKKKHGFTSVIHYYKEEYASEIAKFFMKKFLRLFIFLDRAKTSRLIRHDPCLFFSNSDYKSTKDVFVALTTEALTGDGNLFKMLAQVGCQFSYQQTYVDEARYFVQQLMQDLRDGVILCRVVELLTDDYSLMAKLRCPPISILQKVHNVGLTLEALAKKGVQVNDIQAKKIVEGHREKTMTLVNRIMLRFYNIKIGDGAAQLAEVFTRLQASCKGFLVRQRLEKMQDEEDVDSAEGSNGATSTSEASGSEHHLPKITFQIEAEHSNQSHATNSASFESGQSSSMTSSYTSLESTFSSSSRVTPVDDVEALVLGDKDCSHGILAADRRSSGGEPMNSENMDGAQPSECQAVVDAQARMEMAAKLIGSWWKRILLRRQQKKAFEAERQKQYYAAVKIQVFWKVLLRKKLQRKALIAELERKNRAAVIIQAAWRGYRFRRNLNNFPAVVEEVRPQLAAGSDAASEEQTVAVRTKNGLRYLLERQSLEHNGIMVSTNGTSGSDYQRLPEIQIETEHSNQSRATSSASFESGQSSSMTSSCTSLESTFSSSRVTPVDDVEALVLGDKDCSHGVLAADRRFSGGEPVDSENMDGAQLSGSQAAAEAQARMEMAAKLIGSWWKRILLRRQQKKAFEAELQKQYYAAVKIQVFWKALLRKKVQQQQKALIAELERKNRAAVIIQAAWRGYRFRRNPNNFPVVVEEVRQRLAIANDAATEEQTVAVRTRNGLRYLLERQSLEHIRLGLKELDVVTRLSPVSCLDVVEQGAISVLFELIHQMNHSVACQEITALALSILFNIAKYENTRASICEVKQWFKALVKILRNFETSGVEDVFLKASMLLVILWSVNEAKAGIDNNKMSLKNLRDIHARFKNREARRQEEEKQMLLKQRGKADVVLNRHRIHVPAPFWTRPVVPFTPDWDLTKDKPNEKISKEAAIGWVAYVYKGKLRTP